MAIECIFELECNWEVNEKETCVCTMSNKSLQLQGLQFKYCIISKYYFGFFFFFFIRTVFGFIYLFILCIENIEKSILN